MPSKVLNFKTPLVVLKDFFPPITRLSSNLPVKVFGCICYVHLPSPFRSKLDHRAINVFFWAMLLAERDLNVFILKKKKIM